MWEDSIRADNACFEAARRPGITLAMHLCRGNNPSNWYAEGGYDAIAEKLFTTMAADHFLLEYDDERSVTFEPLRFIPKSKTVVLGLVRSKRPQLEKPTTSSSKSRKRRSIFLLKIWLSIRSAVSLRLWREICSPKRISGPSSGWWLKPRGAFGVEEFSPGKKPGCG